MHNLEHVQLHIHAHLAGDAYIRRCDETQKRYVHTQANAPTSRHFDELTLPNRAVPLQGTPSPPHCPPFSMLTHTTSQTFLINVLCNTAMASKT